MLGRPKGDFRLLLSGFRRPNFPCSPGELPWTSQLKCFSWASLLHGGHSWNRQRLFKDKPHDDDDDDDVALAMYDRLCDTASYGHNGPRKADEHSLVGRKMALFTFSVDVFRSAGLECVLQRNRTASSVYAVGHKRHWAHWLQFHRNGCVIHQVGFTFI